MEKHRAFGIGAVLLAAAIVTSPRAAMAVEYVFQVIAESGDLAPGVVTTDGPATFSNFQLRDPLPAMNRWGEVVFRGYLDTSPTDVTADNDEALWSGNPAGLSLLAREGDPIEPGSSTSFDNIQFDDVFDGSLIINDLGMVAFGAETDGPLGGSLGRPSGIFAGLPGQIGLAAITGQIVPDYTPGGTFAVVAPAPLLTDNDLLIYDGILEPGSPPMTSGTWVGTPGTQPNAFALAALSLEDAPDISAAANENGDIIRPGCIQNSSGVPTGVCGLHAISTAYAPRSFVGEGLAIPGFSDTTFRGGGAIPSINNNGSVLFNASFSDANSQFNSGIWLYSIPNDSYHLIVRDGAAAPHTGGLVFDGFTFEEKLAIGANDFFAFQARAEDPNNIVDTFHGVWAGTVGDYHLAVKTGDSPTGTNGDLTLVALGGVNGAGEILVIGRTFDGVAGSNNGLWAGPLGALQKIVQENDQIELGGSSKTIQVLRPYFDSLPLFRASVGNEDGKASWFNRHGQIVFMASFAEGGSAVLRATPLLADAGPDQDILFKKAQTTEVTLDGSASDDLIGEALSYSWTLNGIEIATGEQPIVTLGEGTHVISLVVSFGSATSAADDVVITVTKDRGKAQCNNPNSNKPECQS